MSTVKSISERLNSSIKRSGTASLVLSGGSSPIKIFEELSSIDLPWSKVQVTLVDDRLVEADNKDSNQNLILNYFLKSKAKAAQFFPLTEDLITKSNFFKTPFDVVLLGMGEDGHFASLFPDMIDDFDAFNSDAKFKIFKTESQGNPFLPRITMNLSLILNSEMIVLLVKGKSKLKVLDEAINNNKLPIHYLLKNRKENFLIEKIIQRRHQKIIEVTKRIAKRSLSSRQKYLNNITSMEQNNDTDRNFVSCSNMAHAAAAAPSDEKNSILMNTKPNIGIVSSYNDMLSAHKPLEHFPKVIKAAATQFGATAQMAGMVPAMCDGVTQGRPGMELSLMSRDVIAMSTAVSLSHGVYDAALCLGVCDKIVPGLLIGTLSFGYLPVIFVPAGPMSTGITNEEKNLVRKAFAKGDATREELLKAEISAYHGEGTCTFFGTANSNQMLMEIMGLHIPGSAFVHPHSDLRNAYNIVATEQAISISRKGADIRPIGKIIDERSFVNAIVGLHATGGSTNHTLHLPAMAAAAGIKLLWEDFSDLSEVTPLLARVYPNGNADVNQFHAAGGMSFVIGELLDAGLLDGTARTVWGDNLFDYISEPTLKNSKLVWNKSKSKSFDSNILKSTKDPHQKNGGLKMLKGNIGRGVIKISAVNIDQQKIKAPAMVFDNQIDVKEAYDKGLLNRDVVIVVRFQGPKANGMPELHALTPILSNIQDLGFKVALLTDGRMSGASGKVPAAIHITPEAMDNGVIGKIKDGDEIEIDAISGHISLNENYKDRALNFPNDRNDQSSFGRNLFSLLRQNATNAENGAGLNLIDTH